MTDIEHLEAIANDEATDNRVKVVTMTLLGLLLSGDEALLIALAYEAKEISRKAMARCIAAKVLGCDR